MRKDIRVRPGKAQSMISFCVGIAFVLIGVCFAIPMFGSFGILWTIIALVITVVNGINAFSKKGIATAHFEVQQDQEFDYSSSSEQRLQEAKDLYEKGLMSKEEYEEKRKEILKQL